MSDSHPRTVAVTGGNGQVGRAVLHELNDHDYHTVNVSRGRRREDVADGYQQADLLDAGEVYGALAACDADAVVHLGMRPRPDDAPGHVTFESNVMTTYHVLEACENLGVDTVAIASSMSALGAGFDPDPVRLEYLPVDEDHPVDPRDPYALGKRVLEVTADGVGRRNDGPTTVTTVRFPMAVDDDDLRDIFADSDRSLAAIREAPYYHSVHNTLFAYVHLDDLARLFRCCIETDFTGHETVWASAPDTTVDLPTSDLVAEEYPEADRRVELEGFESLVDTTKAEELLDWEPEKSWRD